MDPFSAGIFASIGSAIKFADIAVRIAEVGSENAVFVRTICVVRSDLEEVERLLSLDSVQKKLIGTSGKLPWMKNAINNTRSALNEIGRWVERARVEQESTGSIKFDTRVRWVFNDHEKLLNRKTELSTCHQQLSNVLGYLNGLEEVPTSPVPLGCEDTTHFDDILSRHRRPSGQKASNKDLDEKAGVHEEGWPWVATAIPEHTPSSRPRPVPSVESPLNAQKALKYDLSVSGRFPSMTKTFSPPGSPPPTYATAVSTRSALQDMPLGLCTQMATDQNATVVQLTNSKDGSDYSREGAWAYRSNLSSTAVPELAGDTIIFSATNSAGPVNPYELCASPDSAALNNSSKAQKPCENLAEMLGDLHFPIELPNNPGPPPGYPPWIQTTCDQVSLAQSRGTQSWRRTTSEIPLRVARRPLPANALSDSLLTLHELPPSLVTNDAMLPVSNPSSHPVITGSFATGISSEILHQPCANQRPRPYIADHSNRSTTAPTSSATKHYSAPTPVPTVRNEYAAAFSANSASSWGLKTQPKTPRLSSAQEPSTTRRMQTQKRILNLLDSIDS